MTTRQPPTIGLVGVDFGYKPAISLVPVRKGLDRKFVGGSDDVVGYCTGSSTVWTVTYSGSSGCRNQTATVILAAGTVSWDYFFDPHTSGDRFSVNGTDLGGCSPLFGGPTLSGHVLTASSGFVLNISIQGCCGSGSRNSSYDGYIIANC